MSPFDARYWNLIQTLGWIYLRDRWWVDFSADGAHETRYFKSEETVPKGRAVMFPDPAPRASRIGIIAKAAMMGCTHFNSLKEVEAVVLNALQFGQVRCRGTRNGEGDITDISDGDWDGLKFHEHPDRAGPRPTYDRPGATYWHDLRFEREDVLREWPDPLVVEPAEAVAGDTEAAPGRLTRGARSKGGSRSRRNPWLQEALERIIVMLEEAGTPATFPAVWGWLGKNTTPNSPYEFDPPVSGCDYLYVDGDELSFRDQDGKVTTLKRRSLERYMPEPSAHQS